MRVLGIDPGLSGALAIYNGRDLEIIDMPTIQPGKRRQINEVELARLIHILGPYDLAGTFLEQVATRPGEGAVGAFTFGRGYGFLRGVLRAHRIPLTDVTPSKWKRSMGIAAGSGKDKSRAMATEQFQNCSGLFSRVKDEGRAEAALIALYGFRSLIAQEAA